MANDIMKGMKVVELGTYVAIPYAARELADMGAEVIKIEPPQGEIYRGTMASFFQLPGTPGADYVFTPYNANKKSLSIDLKSKEGVEILRKLISEADIFLTNTREASLEKLGLGLDTLLEQYPKLIIGSVSGFGNKGPDKDRGGYDATSFWSPSGMIQEWNYKGNLPFKPFYGFGDAIAAAHLVSGIMAALFRREKFGHGDVVRVSLLACGLWNNVCGLLRYQAGHKFPKDYTAPIVPLDNFYETKDGKWFLASESQWAAHCKAYFDLFGTPELAEDPKWNSMPSYFDASTHAEKVRYFQKHFKEHTAAEIEEKLKPTGVVYSFLDETDDVLTNEQAWINENLVNMRTLNGTQLTISNIPLRFDSTGLIDEIKPAPQLGENSVEVLTALGYDDDAIAKLVEAGTVVAYKK